MSPERRSDRNRHVPKVYEGSPVVNRGRAKKKPAKQPAKQSAKRKRQQSINKADKPLTDADRAIEDAEQVVILKQFMTARLKAKTTSKPVPSPERALTSSPVG
jgi:hypothetical protein